MKLIKTKIKDSCDACKQKTEESFSFTVGTESFSVCKSCLINLYRLLGKKIVPKSIETIGIKNKKGDEKVEQTIR